MILDSSVFIVIGTILPWTTWIDPEFLPLPRLLLLAALVLILRRLPATLALYKFIPQLKTPKEVST